MKIVALDLGKFNSVACVYEGPTGDHRFQRVRTTPQHLHDLVVEVSPDLVVIEVCSFAGWIHDLVTALDVEIVVANPAHEGWRWNRVKRKTDRDDALKLAKLAAMNQLPTVYIPDLQTRQWRSLIAYRHKLVGRQTAIRNNIRSILSRLGLSMASGHRAWTRAGIEALRARAQPLHDRCMADLWQGMLELELTALEHVQELLTEVNAKLATINAGDERVRLVQSIPGVGPRLAEIMVATIDDPHRFRNGRQVACYAGLTPKQYESGTMRRAGRISRHGSTLLRTMLVEVSWLVRRYNAWGRAVFDNLARGQRSRRKQAIVAVARRLLVRAWAMLRDQTTWAESPRAPACA